MREGRRGVGKHTRERDVCYLWVLHYLSQVGRSPKAANEIGSRCAPPKPWFCDLSMCSITQSTKTESLFWRSSSEQEHVYNLMREMHSKPSNQIYVSCRGGGDRYHTLKQRKTRVQSVGTSPACTLTT